MVAVKEMPYSEKYAKVIDSMKFSETLNVPFVQKHLGDQAVAEFRKTRQEGMKPIPEGASFEEKYELAYANWIWSGKNTFSFIRERMGEDGLKKYERTQVELLKKKNASPAFVFLKLIRLFSPGTAFAMTAKQMGYQLQWISPGSVSEFTKQKVEFNISRCKILDFPGTEDLCFVGCQSIYPKWVAEQLKVDMKFNRQGNDCTCILTPLS
jgi:hypothetical protein